MNIELIIETFGTIGGVGAIIFGLSAWLGKVWANRIFGREKAQFQQQLEHLKHRLTIEQERTSRFSDMQFEYYMSLWNSLQDLKFAGKDLWNKANKQNLINFSKVLWDTDRLVEKSRIFLEKPHYIELKEILSIFKDFEFGKLKLIELRDEPPHPSSERELTEQNISRQIENNRAIKERYETLLEQIGFSLQDQLSAHET